MRWPRPSLEHRALCRQLAGVLVEPLRRRASQLGYALLEHGSRERDIDLVACPWTVDAVDGDELVRELIAVVKSIRGFVYVPDRTIGIDPYDFSRRCPEPKPHGRVSWSIHLGGGPYIDLSVMPRIENPIAQLHRELEENIERYRVLCADTKGLA